MDEFYFLFGTSVKHLDLMWHWKRRNCSLWYSVHLRPLWRGFPLLLTAIQLYQPMPVGFRPCSLSSTWAHCVPLASSPFSSLSENWWLRQGCSYVGKVLAKSGNKALKARAKPILSPPNPGSWLQQWFSAAAGTPLCISDLVHTYYVLHFRRATPSVLILLSCYIQKLPLWIPQPGQPSYPSKRKSVV